MLRLHKVGRSGLGYYLDPATVDAECGDASGRYLGGLATALGLTDAAADGRTLPLLLDGVDPLTGELLDRRHDRVRVLAYDCTFAAPKSVSLLALLDGGDEQVVDAHRRSVLATLGYLEREAALVRRGGESRAEPAGGLIGAAFVHRTSRSDDPHLHTHLLVANLSCDRRGRYSAIDGRALYEELRTAGALYRCQLRHELSSTIGVHWQRDGRGFNDVSGLSRRTLASFSQRAAEIAEELDRTGRRGAKAHDLAGQRTRGEKDRATTRSALDARWQRQRQRSGLSSGQLTALRDAPARAPIADVGAAVRAGAAVLPDAFGRSELLASSTAVLHDGAPIRLLEAAADELLGGPEVTRVGESGQRHGRSHEIPRPRLEARYLTAENARRRAENSVRLATARPLPGDDTLPPGLYRAPDLASVATLAGRLRLVCGVARTRGLAAHLEGMTGARPLRAGDERAARAGALVVYGPEQLAPRELESLLGWARRRPVVLLARDAPLGPQGSDLPSLEVEAVEGVRLHRAADPVSAVRAAERLARALDGDGRPAVVVSAEPALLEVPAVPPHRVKEALRCHERAVAVVLGPAELLGAGLGAIAPERRLHVLVARGAAARDAGGEELARLLGAPGRCRDNGARQGLGEELALGRER